MSIFEKNGVICSINRVENEADDIFSDRGWFVVSQNPTTEEDLKKYIKYSVLWSNIKQYNCSYSNDIMDKLKKMEENLWDF